MKSDLAVSDLAVCGGGLEFWTPRKGSAPWSSAMTWAVINFLGSFGSRRGKDNHFFCGWPGLSPMIAVVQSKSWNPPILV